MDTKTIYKDTRDRMGKSIEALENNLGVLRTGRAHPGLLKKVMVEQYGTQMPLEQVASVNAPDARTLTVSPWDKGTLGAIEKAIREADLGLNPNNKGDVIFITIPSLTEERRKELVKNAKGYAEEARVAIRSVRKQALDDVKKLEGMGEDEIKRAEDEVQNITDEFVKKVDEVFERKEKEILN